MTVISELIADFKFILEYRKRVMKVQKALDAGAPRAAVQFFPESSPVVVPCGGTGSARTRIGKLRRRYADPGGVGAGESHRGAVATGG